MMPLERENARLFAQVEAFTSDEHLRAETRRWRDATPQQRVAETWRLSGWVPWFRSLWSAELRERAARPEPLPSDTIALLERMKATGVP